MTSFFKRLWMRRRIHRLVSLWYHPHYESASLARTARTLGLIPERGRRILSSLIRDPILKVKDFRTFPWLTLKDLLLFHSDSYLESVSQPEILGRIFGLEPHEVRVDELLTAQRWAVSGTYAATVSVLKERAKLAFNLGGGFHHAEPEQGAGFCVYNDIGIAVKKIRQRGFSDPIAIVDLDYHQGNGNIVGFAEDESVGVFSIHGSVWTHVSGKSQLDNHLAGAVKDEEYLNTLTDTLPPFLKSKQIKLIFYLAGNDVLRGDPLGGYDLSLEAVFKRDRFLVDWAQRHSVPIVITLAGGYSLKACRASLNLLLYLLGNVDAVSCEEEEELSSKFSKIAAELDPFDLQRDRWVDFTFSEADLLGSLDPHAKRRRILGYYSAYGIELAMERYGLFKKAGDLGYTDFRVTVDAADPSHQLIRVKARPSDKPESPHVLLGEIVLREETLNNPKPRNSLKDFRLLSIEWLLLQDPNKPFTMQSPPFPGQEHPGLGIAKEVQLLLIQMCRRLGWDGLLNRPSYYHIALGASPQYQFFDPKVEGRFQALQEMLKDQELIVATQWVADEKLKWTDGSTVQWEAATQVLPLSQELKEYFQSENYQQIVTEEKQRYQKI